MIIKTNHFNFGWQSILMWVILTVIGCAIGWLLGMVGYFPSLEFGGPSEFRSVVIQLSSIGGGAAIFQWFVIRRILPHAWTWPVITVAAWITGCLGLGLLPVILTSTEVVFFSLVAAWAGALQWLTLRQRFFGGVWWISLSAAGSGAGWFISRYLAEVVSIRMVGSYVPACIGYILGFGIAARLAQGVFAGFGYGLGLGIATGLALAVFLKARPDTAPVRKVSAV